MRVSAEAHWIRLAQTEVQIALGKLQKEHDLTNIEMMQAVNEWQATKLKSMLRFERHCDYETPADVAAKPNNPG